MTTQRLQSFVNQRGAGSFVISLLVLLALTSGVFVGSAAIQNRTLNLGGSSQATGCNYTNPYQCNGHDGCTWTGGSCQSTSTSSNPPAQPPGGSTGGGNQTGNQSGGSTGDVCAGQRRAVCEGNLRQFCTWCNDECVAGNSCSSRPGGGSGSGSQCQRPRTGECMTRNSRGCTLNSGQVGTCEHPGTTQKQCCAASSPDTGRTDTTRSSCEQGGGRCIQSTGELASCLGAGGHYGQGDHRGCPNFPGYGGICCKTNWERPRTGGGVPPHSSTGCLVGQAADFCYGPRTPGVPREPRTGESCPLSATQTGVCLRESGIIKCCPRRDSDQGTQSSVSVNAAVTNNSDERYHVFASICNAEEDRPTAGDCVAVEIGSILGGRSQTFTYAFSQAKDHPVVRGKSYKVRIDANNQVGRRESNIAGSPTDAVVAAGGSKDFTLVIPNSRGAEYTISGTITLPGGTQYDGNEAEVIVSRSDDPVFLNRSVHTDKGVYTLTAREQEIFGQGTVNSVNLLIAAKLRYNNRLHQGSSSLELNRSTQRYTANVAIEPVAVPLQPCPPPYQCLGRDECQSAHPQSANISCNDPNFICCQVREGLVSGRVRFDFDRSAISLTQTGVNVIRTSGRYIDGYSRLSDFDDTGSVSFSLAQYSDGSRITTAESVKVNFTVFWQDKTDSSIRGVYYSPYITDIRPGTPYPNVITVEVSRQQLGALDLHAVDFSTSGTSERVIDSDDVTFAVTNYRKTIPTGFGGDLYIDAKVLSYLLANVGQSFSDAEPGGIINDTPSP